MECYGCSQAARPGGTRYGIQAAVGICQTCGVGVCLTHSRKATVLGAPLQCQDCARVADAISLGSASFVVSDAGGVPVRTRRTR